MKKLDSVTIKSKLPTLKLLQEFEGNTFKHTWLCTLCGETLTSTFSNLVRREQPCDCSSTNKKRSPKRIQEDLLSRDILWLNTAEPCGGKNRISLKCLKTACLNTWSASVDSVFTAKNGCLRCHIITNEKCDARIKGSDIERVDDFINTTTKIRWKCLNDSCGNVWSTKPLHVFRGKGCPACAKSGFDPANKGFVYFGKLAFESQTFWKIGITNRKPLTRLKECHKNFELVGSVKLDGESCVVLENFLKERYKHLLTHELKGIVSSGHTEIFKIPT